MAKSKSVKKKPAAPTGLSTFDTALAQLPPELNGDQPTKSRIRASRRKPRGGADVAGITERLQETLTSTDIRPTVTEIGSVIYVGDGVIKVTGLPTAEMEHMITIETYIGPVSALILGLHPDAIEAVVLGDYSHIRQGDIVRSSGSVLQIPAGEQALGRIISPIGLPVDGGPELKPNPIRPIECAAPGVAKRKPVTQQFESGVLVVDTLIPLGKGQRELVIGDRKSGKTRLMANFIINQASKGIFCVYVAIGAQKAKIRAFEELLRQNGAMEYTTIILGGSDDPPSLNYLAPYAGAALGEYFMYSGRDVICIYDDLSRHAKAYRQMSLLLKRSPGRDAYPGDIFYLHSRLLERSARMLPEYGGGSLTAFPMAETQNGDVSEYICTNLMSITDGHIYLDVNFLHEGILPAVNPSISVSRIGGSVQIPILRKMGEVTSKQMARYNEVKSFETINTEISEETEGEIRTGKHLLEVFGQDSSINFSNDEKIILLYLVTTGKTKGLELADLRKLKVELIEFYRNGPYTQFREQCATADKLEAIEPLLITILSDYVAQSQIPNARSVIEGVAKEEKPLPIIPDPASQGLTSAGKTADAKESSPAAQPPAGNA